MNPKYSKIVKGAGIAGAGAILTYLLQEVPNIDFGTYQVYVAAVLSTLINALLKVLKSAEETETESPIQE